MRAAQTGGSVPRGLLPALALTLVLLAPPGVRGQSTDLTGTVVDSLTNEVLPNVLVSLGESSFGAHRCVRTIRPRGPPCRVSRAHHRTSQLPDARAGACRRTDRPAEGAAGARRHRARWNTRSRADTGLGRQSRDQPDLDLPRADPGSAVPGRAGHLPLAPALTGRERNERRHLGTLRTGWDTRRKSGAPGRHDRLPRGPLLRNIQRLQRRRHQGRGALQVRVSGTLRRAHVQRGEHDREGRGSPGLPHERWCEPVEWPYRRGDPARGRRRAHGLRPEVVYGRHPEWPLQRTSSTR